MLTSHVKSAQVVTDNVYFYHNKNKLPLGACISKTALYDMI